MSIFTNDYIEKNYKEFFAKYGIPVAETKLSEIIAKAWANKADMRKFYPFNNEGRLNVTSYAGGYDVIRTSLGKTIDAIMTMYSIMYEDPGSFNYETACTGISEKDIFNNCVSVGAHKGRKISKLIASGPLLNPNIRHWLVTQDLCTELPNLPLQGKDNPGMIVQNFYSEIAKLKSYTTTLQLSVNPIDILNASTGRVHSCNSIGNAAESAPMSVATSSRMAIARVVADSTGEMLGRCYVGMSPSMQKFVFQPCYGAMSKAHVTDLMTWLTNYVDSQNFEEGDWKLSAARIKVPTEILAESEDANFYTDASQSFLYKGSLADDVPGLYINSTYCVVCGKPGSKKLICTECTNKQFAVCHYCGYLSNNTFIGLQQSEQICRSCAVKLHVCHFCNDMFIKTNSAQLICPACANTTEHVCVLCGAYGNVTSVESSIYNTRGMAELLPDVLYAHHHCMNGKVKMCSACGEFPVTHKTGALCYACAKENLFKVKVKRVVNTLKTYFKALSTTTIFKPVPLDTKCAGINDDKDEAA